MMQNNFLGYFVEIYGNSNRKFIIAGRYIEWIEK